MSKRTQPFHGYIIIIMVKQEGEGLVSSNCGACNWATSSYPSSGGSGLWILKIESILGDRSNLSQRQQLKMQMPWAVMPIHDVSSGGEGAVTWRQCPISAHRDTYSEKIP